MKTLRGWIHHSFWNHISVLDRTDLLREVIDAVTLPSFFPLLTPNFCLYWFSFSPRSPFRWIQSLLSTARCGFPLSEFFILICVLAKFHHQHFFFFKRRAHDDCNFWFISCWWVSASWFYAGLTRYNIFRSHFFPLDLFQQTLCPVSLNVAIKGVWDQLDFFLPLKTNLFKFFPSTCISEQLFSFPLEISVAQNLK